MVMRSTAGNKLFLADYTWEELDKIKDKKKIIFLLPIGAIEEHGYHLPLKTDIFLASQIAEKAALKVPGVIVMPDISYGFSITVANYSGTITIAPDTLISLVCDIVESLYRNGFRKLVIYNGHGGNRGTLDTAQREALRRLCPAGEQFDPDFDIYLSNVLEKIAPDLMQLAENKDWGHACQIETSIMLSLEPELVDMTKAVEEYLPGDADTQWRVRNMKKETPAGVHGAPKLSSAGKGDKIVELLVNHLVQLLQRI
jgi:creatinine amidohydrolase